MDTVEQEWSNLLESSNNLNLSHVRSRINRSLSGIEKEAQRLSSKSSRHVPANQLKDFAAQAGVDIRNQSQYISSIDSLSIHTKKQKLRERKEERIALISGLIRPTNAMDLNNFLKYHHEYVISSTIQECHLLSCTHFRTKYGQSIQNEWDQTKTHILSYLGCDTNSGNHNTEGRRRRTVISDTTDTELRQCLSKVIYDLSAFRNNLSNHRIAPIQEISGIYRKLYAQSNESNELRHHLCSFWECLSFVIFERGQDLNENQYGHYSLSENIALQKFLLSGARQYLERMYFDFITREVSKNKLFAKKGGKPGQRYTIKAFVRLKYQNGTIIPNEYHTVRIEHEKFPLWPLIYYSYRIGDLDSCIYFAQFDQGSANQIVCESLCELREERYKQSMDDSTAAESDYYLSEKVWKSLEKQVKDSSDPFQIFMFILIGKLFVNDNEILNRSLRRGSEEVMSRKEDYLWFKLCTLYVTAEERPPWINLNNATRSVWNPCITLQALQSEIKVEIGQSNKILFLISLILSLQFDDCTQYLAQIGHGTEATHLNICLRYYGLTKHKQPLCHMMDDSNQDSFYYLYMMDELESESLVSLLCKPDKELRRSVLGVVSNDGINIHNSLLYKYSNDIATFVRVCQMSATEAYENGEIEHCIILNILCGDFCNAAQLCIKLLASHITDKAHNHSKQFIINLAKHLYTSNKQICQNCNFHSLSLINPSLLRSINGTLAFNLISAIHFAEFYNLFYKPELSEKEKALRIINTNGIVPVNDENIINLLSSKMTINSILRPYMDQFLKLESDLRKYISEICIAVMKILLLQFQSFQNNKQIRNAKHVSTKCFIIYNFFNNLESQIKPIGAGDTAKQISNLYFQTRMD